MKIAVVGPGAMGCLLAGFLTKSGEEVWLLDKRPERAEKIKRNGIRIEGISGEHKLKVNVATNPTEIGEVRLVILCVKSYDTEAVLPKLRTFAKDESLFLTLQNGTGNIEALSEAVGKECVLGGVTSHGATLLGDGHVRHAGRGDTVVGKIDGKNEKAAREVASVLTKAGFETKVSRSVNDLIWGKLIINVGINALTAITRLNNGRLTEYEGTRAILREAVREAVQVSKKKRIKLLYEDPIKKVEAVCSATAKNVSSMLQDVLKEKKTEIDSINGAIIRHAQMYGVKTPVNEVLTRLVKTIEDSYQKRVQR